MSGDHRPGLCVSLPYRCPRCGGWLDYGRCKHGCDTPDPGLAAETERLGLFPALPLPRKLFAEERSAP